MAGEVRTLALKPSNLDLNLESRPSCNRQPGVLQAGRSNNVCAVSHMDAKLGIPSTSIGWWTLKIPLC